MSDQVVFRPFNNGDEEKITLLLDIAFDGWPGLDLDCTSLDHWFWKFRAPAENKNTVVVAESPDGEIIGVNQAQLKNTKIGNKVVQARKTTEVAVHPEYRGKGVHRRLALMGVDYSKSSGAVFSYSLSTSPIIVNYKQRESEYYEFPQPIKQLVKIESIPRFSDYWKEHKKTSAREILFIKSGLYITKFLNRLTRIFKKRSKPETGFEIKLVSRFDEKIQPFWEKIQNDYDFILEKSVEHLNWRYCDPRGGSYKVFTAEEDGELLGYIVICVTWRYTEHPVGYIMELLVLTGRDDVAEALVRHAEKYFRDKEVNAIYFTVVSRHPYEKLLGKYGFIDSRRRPLIYYRVYKDIESLEEFKNSSPERLHYQFGEFDSI
jgi:GNAT superfamily N-acetyltransferase